MNLRHITADNAALMVIDYQERLLKIMNPMVVADCVRNINLATRLFQKLGAQVWVTEQYVKGLGPTYEAIKQHVAEVQTYEKMDFSCCDDPQFMKALKKSQKTHIILTGMEAHICVLHTALDLLERGYQVCVLADAVQSSTKLKWETALRAMEQAGVTVLPTESVLFGLLRRCEGENFKFLAGMLKE